MGHAASKPSGSSPGERGERTSSLGPGPERGSTTLSSPAVGDTLTPTQQLPLMKRNPLDSMGTMPVLATALTPLPTQLASSVTDRRVSQPGSRLQIEVRPRQLIPQVESSTPSPPPPVLVESTHIPILKCDATSTRGSSVRVLAPNADIPACPTYTPLMAYHQTHRSALASPRWSPTSSPGTHTEGGGFMGYAGIAISAHSSAPSAHLYEPTVGSSSTYASGPRLCLAGGGASLSGVKHRRSYIEVEMELPEGDGAGDDELDDFALASTHSSRYAARKPGLTDGTMDSVKDAGLQRAPLATPVKSGGGLLSPTLTTSPRRDGATGDVLEFVSFRRPCLGECRHCARELVHGSNYCSRCGTPTEALLTPADQPSAASRSLTTYSPVGVSLYRQRDGSGRALESPSPAPTAGGSSSSIPRLGPSTRRRVYRRRVRIVGRYEKKALLGTGSSGAVFRAVDVRTGQHLAVKEMIVDPKDDFEIASIRNELRHLASLRHRHIIEYLGCSIERVRVPEMISLIMDDEEADPQLSPPSSPQDGPDADEEANLCVRILMERMECGTLQHLMEEFPDGMPESAVRNYLSQLLNAVAYLHGRGLTHRDIKPSNILMSSDCLIKLSDFGCAVFSTTSAPDGVGRARQPAGSAESLHKVAGTPAYMPPEALLTAGRSPTEMARLAMAQDTWAIGCVAHQLLTGQAPWSHVEVSNQFALLLHIQRAAEGGEEEAFPINDSISTNAHDFCRLCFQRDPVKRARVAELLHHPFIVCDASDSETSF